MPRKGPVTPRKTKPDPRYNDVLVAKTINVIMRDGKKSLAERIFYKAMDIIEAKRGVNPAEVFKQAINNAKPMVEVKSRRVGGASYQVPVDIRHARRYALAIRWIVQFAKRRKGRNMAEKLAAEIMDAANNTGGAVAKREETHRMAEANKVFAHYRW